MARPFVEAAAMGLGVGLEREWSRRGGEQQAAGSRTFAVLGLAGAVAARLGDVVVAAGAGAAGLILAAGYLRTAEADRGTTTELAAVATFLLGALMTVDAALAVGLAVVMTVLLAAKGPIHRLARELLTGQEVEDALRFFVIAFVLLPLLPDRPMGPYGALNPSRVWLLVVTLTGIGWIGWIAVRALGPGRGTLVTGFAGGFISATATTASLARSAKDDPAVRSTAVGGALLATAATFIQLGLVVSVVNRELLHRLVPAIIAGLVVLAGELVVLYRRAAPSDPCPAAAAAAEGGSAEGGSAAPGARLGRPFALGPAIVLAATLTLVVLLARWAADQLGAAGAVVAAGAAGFADVHAAALAAATLGAQGSMSSGSASTAIGIALVTNTASKAAVAFGAGGRRFGARFSLLIVGPVSASVAVLLVSW